MSAAWLRCISVARRITDQGPDERKRPASLALRLAADLAEAMGITLRCERTSSSSSSSSGGGRTVIIILPAAAHLPSAPPVPAEYPDDDLQLT